MVKRIIWLIKLGYYVKVRVRVYIQVNSKGIRNAGTY